MPFIGMLNKAFKIQRQTDNLLASVSMAASHTLDTSAGQTCNMQVVIAGADTNGTVTLVGNVDGSSTSEILTFTGAGAKLSRNAWDNGNLTEIQTSGLTGTIIVNARGRSNARVIFWKNIIDHTPGRLWQRGQNVSIDIAGQQDIETDTIFIPVNSTVVQPGDRVVDLSDTTKTYLINGDFNLDAYSLSHHWELPVRVE